MQNGDDSRWDSYQRRYQSGESRTAIFRDLVLDDAERIVAGSGRPVLLDIGCGGGFDRSSGTQRSLAGVAGKYVGVEPDTEIGLQDVFHECHRCLFEDASIDPGSIDIAFAVMVLEHFDQPQQFWDKIYSILRPGGVFWGFTVDARHWFVSASLLAEKLHIKDLYLDTLHGRRGEQRYENYGVFYRTNTPEQVASMTGAFSSRIFLNLNRVGQMDYYLPKRLQWVGRLADRISLRMGWPGSTLAVRVTK